MKLLIAGAGFIVQDWLTITQHLKDVDLVASAGVEADKENMGKLQSKYGIKEVYTDYDQALKEANVDTVYVGVPNFLHYSFGKKALNAGKNVICEKP